MVQADYVQADYVQALPSPADRARRADADVVDVAIALLFAMVVVMQIASHEMWRDEIHSWGLVQASSSLTELFANLRYTGHPGLWYLPLWLASWFTDSPYTVQVVHAAISVGLVAVIALSSPFSRLEKLLLLCSYFVLFEYTVISRNYGIGMLLALVYAQCRASRPESLYLNGFILGLLANTSLFGLVLSAAFACELALEMLLRRGNLRAVVAPLARGAALYVPLAVLAAATIWPAPDISWRTTGEPLDGALNVMKLAFVVSNNVTAMLPLHPLDYWISNRDIQAAPPGPVMLNAPIVLLSALPILCVVYWQIFSEHRRLLLIPGLTLIGSIAVGQLIYTGSIRHWGINFVAFVAALWILRAWSPTRSLAAFALLGISAVAGIAISVQQAQVTFSEAGPTARWIRDNGLADDLLIATPDTMVSSIAVYLGKPAYYLDCSCIDDYMVFHNRRDSFEKREIPARLARALEDVPGRPALFVTSDRLTPEQAGEIADYGIGTRMLAEFTDAGTDEEYFVYRVVRPSGSAAAGGASG